MGRKAHGEGGQEHGRSARDAEDMPEAQARLWPGPPASTAPVGSPQSQAAQSPARSPQRHTDTPRWLRGGRRTKDKAAKNKGVPLGHLPGAGNPTSSVSLSAQQTLERDVLRTNYEKDLEKTSHLGTATPCDGRAGT